MFQFCTMSFWCTATIPSVWYRDVVVSSQREAVFHFPSHHSEPNQIIWNPDHDFVFFFFLFHFVSFSKSHWLCLSMNKCWLYECFVSLSHCFDSLNYQCDVDMEGCLVVQCKLCMQLMHIWFLHDVRTQ